MSGDQSGSGSGTLSTFWQRSTDKLNPKKFKFVSNAAKTGNNGNQNLSFGDVCVENCSV
jgi:hypothetical protein